MDMTILVIEDDQAIVRLLKAALSAADHKVISASAGLEGLNLFLSHHPSLVLLDLGLPDIEGQEVLRQIKQMSSTPVIILSARDKDQEKVLALDAGADDYITKPFSTNELNARIRVALRHHRQNTPSRTTFVCGDLSIDFEKYLVSKGGVLIHLTPIEFKILALLVNNQGKVLTHSFLQNNVWGYPTNDDYQTLRVFMAALRRKIEDLSNQPKYIFTEIGIGYRFVDE
jgi:two-component system KDP operon response regulator KdpE